MLKLIVNNTVPAPTDRKRLLDAIIRRALMTDSAPASFFGEAREVPRQSQCPRQ